MSIHSCPLGLRLALAVCIGLFVAGCGDTPAARHTTVGTDIDDAVVSTKVKSALVADRPASGLAIKVETRKGVVLLSGFVEDQAVVDRAASVARGIEGVQGVQDATTRSDG